MQGARYGTCVSPKQSPLHPANIVEIASSLCEPHRKRTPGPNSGQGRWILILIRSGGVCWVTMQESVLILTLTGSLAAALTLGYVTQRLRLSPIIGYLLAGLIVGPYSPGFVADRAVANEFAEIGIVLLMFGVGLQFHVKDLLAVRKIAIVGALAQSAVTTVLGTLAGL